MFSEGNFKQKKVLVLHPNDELKLISLQSGIKNCIKNSVKDCSVFSVYPLWGLLEEQNESSFKEILKNVISLKAENIYFKGNTVCLSVSFTFADNNSENTFKADFQLVKFFPKKQDSVIQEIKELNLNQFYIEVSKMNIKIFRIAEAHFNRSNNEYFLTDSEWKKIC